LVTVAIGWFLRVDSYGQSDCFVYTAGFIVGSIFVQASVYWMFFMAGRESVEKK